VLVEASVPVRAAVVQALAQATAVVPVWAKVSVLVAVVEGRYFFLLEQATAKDEVPLSLQQWAVLQQG
jgi:hypothetical protein